MTQATTTGRGGTTRKRWFERLADRLESMRPRGFWKDPKDPEGKRKLIRIGGQRMIYREGDNGVENYLERFYILSTPWLGIYIHRFWASDEDGLHDHPWNSVSILLDGCYNEEMPERKKVPYGPTITKLRRPFHPWFYVRTRYDAHRITVVDGKEGAWSLFIRFGLKRRMWGFYRHRGWEAAEVQSRKDEDSSNRS